MIRIGLMQARAEREMVFRRPAREGYIFTFVDEETRERCSTITVSGAIKITSIPTLLRIYRRAARFLLPSGFKCVFLCTDKTDRASKKNVFVCRGRTVPHLLRGTR